MPAKRRGGRDDLEIWSDDDVDELSALGVEEKVNSDEDLERLRSFIDIYITKYCERVEAQGLEPDRQPNFYADYPFEVTLYKLPNGAMCAAFVGGTQALNYQLRKANYDLISRKLKERELDHFQGYMPYQPLSEEAAIAKARKDAIRDIRAVERSQNITAIKEHIAGLEKEIENVAKMNPWLEDSANSQTEHLSETQSLLESMQQQVARQEEEKFNHFEDELDRLAAYNEAKPSPKAKPAPPPKPAAAPAPPPPRQSGPPRKVREAFVQIKKEKVEPPPKPEPKKEVPDELRNTVFRMNRRVFAIEQKVDPMEQYVKANMAQMQKAMKVLQKRQAKSVEKQRIQMDEMEARVERAYRKGKSAVNLAAIATVLSLMVLLFFLFGDMLLGAI